MMWSVRGERLERGRCLRFDVEVDGRPATWADALDGLQNNEAFRSLLDATLAGAPFDAFRWETPPVTDATLTRSFEFVLLDSPALARRPDPQAFAEHFDRAPDAEVVVFPNLGGDAVMIVPCPIAPPMAYGHLAAFVREASDRQRHALWHAVGRALARRVGAKPVWLSTAGAGVSWLHVRLDDRPKYYGFGPYRSG